MEMDGHLHSSPPVTAFAICFRQTLAPRPPSRPLSDFTTTRVREPPQRAAGGCQAVAHEEGRTVFRVAAVGRAHICFQCKRLLLLIARAAATSKSEGQKPLFGAIFEASGQKKVSPSLVHSLAKTALFEVRAAADGEEERLGNLI